MEEKTLQLPEEKAQTDSEVAEKTSRQPHRLVRNRPDTEHLQKEADKIRVTGRVRPDFRNHFGGKIGLRTGSWLYAHPWLLM